MRNGALVWQRVLLLLCFVGLLGVAECAWATYYLEGDFFGGSVYNPVTVAPFLDRFESVTQGSVAERRGIHAGDAIDLRRITPDERYHVRTGEPLAGDAMRLAIVRDGAERFITVTPQHYTQTAFWLETQWWLAWAFWIGSAFSLLIAATLVWRRPESDEVRLLSLTLILIVLGESLFPINGFLTPWAAFDAVVNVIAQFLFSAGTALIAGYALLFGRPVSATRLVLTGLAFVFAALSALLWTNAAQGGPGPGGLLGIAGLWFGVLDVHAWIATKPALLFATTVGPPALAMLCAVLAVAAANGSERTRVAWATGSLAILYIFGIACVQSYFTSNIVTYYFILNLCWILAPIGLMYALLRRRLLDIGFVLNRAAVFTGVSLLVVGVFILAEWALTDWLTSAGIVANVAVSAALALALGLSIRQIHARVDRFVDSVFFRKRHEDERALNRFAREVAFITNADIVIRRAVDTLEQHADATRVILALDDGDGRYGDVDENDPALVALRSSHEIVDLRTVDTEFPGEFAYPMLARGRLIGALVLGPKASGEPYAPDESAAIAQVAHGVGISLDLLGAKAGRIDREILDALRALPDAIAERLAQREQRGTTTA